jgi:hypothetical protein
MRLRIILTGTILLTALPLLAAPAPASLTRWVMADDVRVRAGPSAGYKITGTLPRGAELVLQPPKEIDGFCHVEGEGQTGFVSCALLSATRIARPHAGINGIDAAQRWITGTGVTLRDAPSAQAVVVQRLSLNSIVKLIRDPTGSQYCEVQPPAGPAGFTACHYLAQEPLNLARIMGVPGMPDTASPERAFWLQPSWNALERYARYLERRDPTTASTGPWPRDDTLEKMKAHLALGIVGPKPAALADWADLKRKAAKEMDLSGAIGRMRTTKQAATPEQNRRIGTVYEIGSALIDALALGGHTIDLDPGNPFKLYEANIELVRELALPAIRPSLFRSESDLAPPGATAAHVSGRFGIVFRQLTTRRPTMPSVTEPEMSPGRYDVLARTEALVRPVQRVQLFRDGSMRSQPSVLSKKEVVAGEAESCNERSAGFAFGHADPTIWRYFDEDRDLADGKELAKRNLNPPGSLFAFYSNIRLPTGPALRVETPMKLHRATTGFVGGTYLLYDLDADGVPDLAIWEGQGRGPGLAHGQSKTDDRWYRLAWVNINGAWKVLGVDEFAYGETC